MNIIINVEHGDNVDVTIHELQFNWNDMLEFGQWCADNDATPLDGLMLAEYIKDKHNVGIK